MQALKRHFADSKEKNTVLKEAVLSSSDHGNNLLDLVEENMAIKPNI